MDGETKETDWDERDERQRRIERLGALAGQQERRRQETQGEQGSELYAATPVKAGAVATGTRRARRMIGTRRVAHTDGGRRAIWLREGAAALAVCVVVAGILVWVHQTRPASAPAKPIPDPLAILLDPSFSCPQEVAWSPDGSKVAVLGFRDCPANSGAAPSDLPGTNSNTSTHYAYGAIYVYDARSGGPLVHIELDTPVAAVAAPHATANAQGQPNMLLDYSDLIWSPDGRRLAVQYGVMAQEQNTPSYVMTDLGTGLLLADPAKGTVQVLPPLVALPAANYGVLGQLYGAPPPTQTPASSYQPVTALRWDLTAGTGSVIQVPQGAGYAWDANGMLHVTSQLPASPDAAPGPASQGAIGNADGGASFSMWQAGAVNYPWRCTDVPYNGGTSVNCCPVRAYYTVSLGVTSAWSPDGRYLVQAPAGLLGASGKIARTLALSTTPDPPDGCAYPEQAASLAPLPVRDRALGHVLASLEAPELNSSVPIISDANVAWSADGQRLAVGYSTSIGVSTSSGLTVFGCTSGKVVATISSGQVLAPLSPDVRARDPVAEIAALAWSPDSQRLQVFDPSHGILLILGAKSLGEADK